MGPRYPPAPVLYFTPLPVKRVHLFDLRTALDEAYVAAGMTHVDYTDPTIMAGTTLIKASHLTELRTFVRNLE